MNFAGSILKSLFRRGPSAADASAPQVPDYQTCVIQLTAPGSPLELEDGVVEGVPMRVFAQRPRQLGALLDAAAAFGDRDCVIADGQRLTYTEFVTQARLCAGGLRSLCGVMPGDRLAILAANRFEWMIAMWGALYVGAVVVALNSWWTPTEVDDALIRTRPKVLIGDAKRLAAVSDRLASLPGIVVSMDDGVQSDAEGTGLAFADLLAGPVAQAPAPTDENDPAAIMFTSGTTGRPSGVVISHRAWIAGLMNAKAASLISVMRQPALAAADTDVRVLASLPFFHVGGGHGVVLGGVASGATVVIPPERFDAAGTLALIARERITRWSAVPAMVRRVCLDSEISAHDLTSVRTIGYGAAPSGTELQDMAYAAFPNLQAVSNAYGLTEAGSVFAMNTGVDLQARPTSVGRAFLTAHIRVVDDGDMSLLAGEIGEVQVRGPILMSGYWGDDKDSDDLFAPGRWLRTGDMGRLDDDGFLFLVDRKKDIIIRGGENIFAGEVERRIEAHPGVMEAAVVAAPSDELGEEVRAVIRLRDGATLEAEAVRAWVRETLAPFKAPRFVEFRETALPRNATGKLLKRVLRDEGAV